MAELIATHDVWKSYHLGRQPLHVLKGITFSVRKGESVAVMGSSGSGKSSLLHILGCLDKPCKGSHILDGVDVVSLSDRETSQIRAQKIGFVFQNFNLISHVSILENVLLPFLYHQDSAHDPRGRCMNLLRIVGLQDRMHHRPTELSGGEQQRAAIARALVHNPPLLLADEPTGNLDSKTTVEILNIFDRLVADGTTLIMVTHNADVAQRCDRVLLMHDGELKSA
jgi:putative ABC transport system ATP-binding protein